MNHKRIRNLASRAIKLSSEDGRITGFGPHEKNIIDNMDFLYWLVTLAEIDEREACLNCYSPDDSATDWAEKSAQGASMNTEDDEFNRIERESVARKMTVKYNLARQLERDGMSNANAQNLTARLLPEAIPFITQEEYQQLLKDQE